MRTCPIRSPDEIEHGILWLQQSLNILGADPKLTEDGPNGPNTMGAVTAFQEKNGLPATGPADAKTIAAIAKQLATRPAPPATQAAPPRSLSDDIRNLFRSVFG